MSNLSEAGVHACVLKNPTTTDPQGRDAAKALLSTMDFIADTTFGRAWHAAWTSCQKDEYDSALSAMGNLEALCPGDGAPVIASFPVRSERNEVSLFAMGFVIMKLSYSNKTLWKS